MYIFKHAHKCSVAHHSGSCTSASGDSVTGVVMLWLLWLKIMIWESVPTRYESAPALRLWLQLLVHDNLLCPLDVCCQGPGGGGGGGRYWKGRGVYCRWFGSWDNTVDMHTVMWSKRVFIRCLLLMWASELKSCVKSRWTSRDPVPNKPTVSVDVKQLFNNVSLKRTIRK